MINTQDSSLLFKGSIWMTLSDIIFFSIIVTLFWEKGGDSEIIYVITILSCFLFGIKFLYTAQCFQSNKIENLNWHRQVEYIPIIFLGISSICIFLVIFIIILHSNNITFFKAFSHIELTTWWLIIVMLIVLAILFIVTLNMVYVHRNNSVYVLIDIDNNCINTVYSNCNKKKNDVQIFNQ
jgi:hypothetical protein